MAFMKKMKDGFNKLVGTPMDAQAGALVRKCEECTSANLLVTDWQLHRHLCIMMNDGDVGANSETVLACLDKRLQSMNPRVQMHALTVCESCVEHCGPAFHEQLAVGPFFKRIRQAVTEPDNPRRDAQVFQKMIVLVEDWARALPYTVFTQALQTALAAGVQLPYRNESDKAPKYDLQAYDQMRIQQADTTSLRQRYAMSQQGHGEYDSIGQTPAGAITCPSTYHCSCTSYFSTERKGGRRQRYIEGAQANSGVDEAVLAALSDADRAAVIAAMAGTDDPESPAPPARIAPGAEDLPKFDCHGTAEQLQADLAVAAEHATLLKDLMQTMESPADAGADSIVSSLVQRCRALQSGVQKVIQKIQDESVMATALQVYEQLNEAVEKFNGEAAPERAESALVAGAGNSEAVQTPSAPQPPLGSTAGSPEPAHASSPPLATAAAAAAAPGPDLIDFGDDEGEPPAAAAAAGSGAPAGASDPMDSLTDVTPGVSVPEPAADAGAGHLAAALNAPVEDAPAGALDLEDAFAGVSLQQPASNTANTSENPFAS